MHTKTIKILMCENKQKPELGLSRENREFRSHAHENQELRSSSHVHEKKSCGAGVMFMKRRAPESEL